MRGSVSVGQGRFTSCRLGVMGTSSSRTSMTYGASQRDLKRTVAIDASYDQKWVIILLTQVPYRLNLN